MFFLLPVSFRGTVDAGRVFPGGLEFSVSHTCSESQQLQLKYSGLLCIRCKTMWSSAYILLGLLCLMAQTKRRPLGDIKSLTTRALSTWGVAELRDRTKALKVWKIVTQGTTRPKNFHPVPIGCEPGNSARSQWRQSQFKGQETPNHVACPR